MKSQKTHLGVLHCGSAYSVTCAVLALLSFAAITQNCFAETFPGKVSQFHSFPRYDFEHGGRRCIVVTPRVAAEGTPWIWRARFFGHQPQADIALLNQGYHVAYTDVGNLFWGT